VSETRVRIQESELIQLTQKLIQIPSEVKGIDDGDEKAIAQFIVERLETVGFTTRTQEVARNRPNVIAVLPGSGDGASLMLNGHIDTIEGRGMTVDPFGGEVKNGKIYGRGAADMKGAIAAMIIASEAIHRAEVDLAGDLTIAACVDEEGRGTGTEALVNSGVRCDAAIVGEPTNMEIGIAHKGVIFIEITTRGRAAHGSTPRLGVNAITAMNQAITAITERLPPIHDQRAHPILGKPTFNVGFIEGGYRPNVVPDFCKIGIDRRLVPGESYRSAMTEIQEILEALKEQHSELDFELHGTNWIKSHPMVLSEDAPVVNALKKHVVATTGAQPVVTTLPFWCDAATLVNKAQVPTAVFGPGEISEAHSATESIDINSLTTYARILVSTILGTCNESGRR
jgi:acetylornithine deacetylase/succinyl-diaminopimelate desuccinylase